MLKCTDSRQKHFESKKMQKQIWKKRFDWKA